jgi:hypothetical protein
VTDLVSVADLVAAGAEVFDQSNAYGVVLDGIRNVVLDGPLTRVRLDLVDYCVNRVVLVDGEICATKLIVVDTVAPTAFAADFSVRKGNELDAADCVSNISLFPLCCRQLDSELCGSVP